MSFFSYLFFLLEIHNTHILQKWVETCKEDSDICGKVFPKRGMKVYYECLEKKKSKIVISVTYLPPVSQTIEFEFEDSSTKLSVLYCNIRAHFAGAFDDFDLKNQKTEHIYKDDDSGRTLSDVALDKGGSLIQVKCSSSSDVIVPTPTPHLDRENKSSTTTTTTKEWGLGMPCLVALTDHGPWVSGVIIKVRKSKSGKETRFTVFVPNMEPVRDVPESRLMPPENNQFVHKNTGVSSYPLVSTPYGFDALLLDTYPDGFCMIGFGRSGPTRDSLVREVYSNIFTFLKSEHASDDLETQKKRIAVARQLARRCVLASGENIRVMRHEVKRKIPLDPPMPSIPPKKELETFSLLEMDRDLENRRAYEIELHGHNFFFSEYDGGREHKVKIELHETATVGHLFTAISERLGVPEEYLVIEKFWRKDLDKAKLDSYEYLQMKAFGSIMYVVCVCVCVCLYCSVMFERKIFFLLSLSLSLHTHTHIFTGTQEETDICLRH